MAETVESSVLVLDPPFEVYLLDPEGLAVLEPLKKLQDLQHRTPAAIQSPWDEKKYLPGIVLGTGSEYVMELGNSLASIIFDETLGWVCRGLLPKQEVLSLLAKEELLKTQTFTEKLVKRTSKKKPKSTSKKKPSKKPSKKKTAKKDV